MGNEEKITRQLNEEEYLEYINQWKLEHKEEIEIGNVRKCFVECLPKKKQGCIDWKKCINYTLYFIYEDINGYLIINDCLKQKNYDNKIKIKYKEKEIDLLSGDLTRCKIGKILGKITSDFKIEIGIIFQDDKRDLTIIDREYRKDKKGYNQKWYKYTCNTCGWTKGWIIESALLRKEKHGCSCCSGHVVLQGINDIPTTANWLIPYFQGGIQEAKLYTKWGSGNVDNPSGYIYPICPACGHVKNKKTKISNIFNQKSIGCHCSDKIPYPEKIIFSVIKQLNIKFTTQLNKSSCEWCDKYRYDFAFVLNNEQYIVETHGRQHYDETTENSYFKPLKKEQQNDKIKKQLALKNGIKLENYIVIDCRKSEIGFIKQSIFESNLEKIFDLSNINWDKAEEFALSSRVKEACEYKRDNSELTTTDIGELMNLDKTTIIKYLKLGSKIWDIIDYIPKEENRKIGLKLGKINSKKVEIFKDNILLGVFPSCSELERQSEKLFGVKLLFGGISAVCTNKSKHYKGYTFKYTKQEEYMNFNTIA